MHHFSLWNYLQKSWIFGSQPKFVHWLLFNSFYLCLVTTDTKSRKKPWSKSSIISVYTFKNSSILTWICPPIFTAKPRFLCRLPTTFFPTSKASELSTSTPLCKYTYNFQHIKNHSTYFSKEEEILEYVRAITSLPHLENLTLDLKQYYWITLKPILNQLFSSKITEQGFTEIANLISNNLPNLKHLYLKVDE